MFRCVRVSLSEATSDRFEDTVDPEMNCRRRESDPSSHGWAGGEEAGWEEARGREGGERDAEQAWLWWLSGCLEMMRFSKLEFATVEFATVGWCGRESCREQKASEAVE